MKKLVLLCALALLMGCAGSYQSASYASRQAYVGMPIAEFQRTAGRKAVVEAMEAGYKVYRMKDYDAWTGALKDTKFFYFDATGKLYKIDGGEFRQNRYQVEVIER